MKKLILIISLIITANLNAGDDSWSKIKNSSDVYTSPLIINFSVITESGKPGIAWLDKSYQNYKYKVNCPWNLLIEVDLSDEIAKKNKLTREYLEQYLLKELRGEVVAHLIASLQSDKGFNLEVYVDDYQLAMKKLQSILDNPNRIVSFNCEITEDPKWQTVNGLFLQHR